jgi:hypothetical protein
LDEILSGGYALPLAVAGAAGLIVWAVFGNKTEAAGSGSGLSGILSSVFGGGKVAWLSVLLTAFQHRYAIADIVSGAAAKLKAIFVRPAPPTDPTEGK